jgi:DNA-binding Xre family transcriptional regulator
VTHLGLALAAYQQKHDVENRAMAVEIGISQSTLSRIKAGTMPDALGFAKIVAWLAGATKS